MLYEQISHKIIGAAFEVHRHLGPGLLESSYRECLYYELVNKGLFVEKEKALPIIYKEVELSHAYRLDLLVNNLIVIELKTVEAFNDVHIAQVLTYLKLGKYPIGLLLNFYTRDLKKGIKRVILNNEIQSTTAI